MKIKWKIALPVLLLMLFATLLTTVIGYFTIKSAVDTMLTVHVDSNLDTLVNQVNRANETEQMMIREMTEKNLSFARLFVESLRLNRLADTQNLDDAAYYQNLADLLNVTEIDVADSSGTIIASNFVDNYGFNYGSTDTTRMYLAILEDREIEIVEAPRASVVSGDMHQYVGIARTDAEGFVQIGFDANAVKELNEYLDVTRTAAGMRIGMSGHAAIVRDGVIVYGKTPESVGRDVQDAAWYRQVCTGRGQSWLDIDGETLYAGFANVNDMTLLVLFPQAEYNTYIAPVRMIGIAGVVVAILSAILIYLLAFHISVPISELAAAAGKIANGELDVPFKGVKGKDEVAFLSLKMHEMTRRLAEARQMELDAIQAQHEKEKAEEANRAKTGFLAMVSHELRTPMNTIIGVAQIELQKKDLPDEQRLAMERVYSSGNILLGIINDILDMSKIETGKMELVPVEYEVSSLINDAVQLNIVRIESKPIRFLLNISESLPARMFGDELRIKQILNNLLSNAIKYTEAGYVKLSVRHSVRHGDTFLHFLVEDTGQGIQPEDQKKLFSKHLRFNIEANRTTEGAGIGLHITKTLVELMDGTIEVESAPGKGSLFAVAIRQTPVGYQTIGPERAKSLGDFSYSEEKPNADFDLVRVPMPHGKVLIVDDMETNLYVAEGLLAQYDLTIETATSGFAAIEKVESGSVYDIIFMDHMMPRMDGIETTQKLRDLGYRGAIVVLTANALTGNDEMFMQRGFDGFLSKPIDVQQLDAILNTFVRGRRPGEEKHDAPRLEADNKPAIDPKLLRVFCGDASKAIHTLRETAANGDIKLFTTTVHAMKSALANVGEHEASGLAHILENAGHSGDVAAISAQIEPFLERLKALVESFGPNPSGINGAQAAEDTGLLKRQMQIIKAACENYDDDAAYAALDGLAKLDWRPETAQALEQLRNALFLHSDFDKAAELAERLLE